MLNSNSNIPKTRTRPIGILWEFIRPSWKGLILLLANFFLISWMTTIQPLMMAPILDVVISGEDVYSVGSDDLLSLKLAELDLNNIGRYVMTLFGITHLSMWDMVVVLALAYLGVSLLLYLLAYLNYLLAIHIRIQSRIRLQKKLFSHFSDLSLDFFNNQRTGEILSWMENDTRASVDSLVSFVQSIVIAPIMIFVYGYLMMQTDARLTVIIVMAALVQYVISRIARDPIRNVTRRQREVMASSSGYLQEVIANMRVVKTFIAEKYEQSRLADVLDKAGTSNFRFGVFKHVEEPIINIINSITNIAILFLVVQELISGELSTSGFFLYIYVGRAILPPVNQLATTYTTFQRMTVSAEKLHELFSLTPQIRDGQLELESFQYEIKLNNLSFQYLEGGESEKILKDINLEIKHGQIVALVGPSGAGKSTLTDILLRFYDPQSGGILIDGQDIREFDLYSYRGLFGTVSQESILFNATIAENIAYARPDISQENIIAAAKVANAHEFIGKLPNGYETLVGDRGVLLSGGQRQRIAIARAVVRAPQILILDEATSSLDSMSEKLVQQAIDRVIENTTAVVIAHRLSTVRNADKIVVMETGKIVDSGTHDELYQRCELYIQLCDYQFNITASDEGR